MKRHVALAAAGLVALSTVAAAPTAEQSQSADHTIELMIGDSAQVEGGPPQGVHPGYFDAVPIGTAGQCSHDPQAYCETVLVRVENPYEEENARKGRERATLNLTLTPGAPGDFDLILFESDEDGTEGAQVGQDASFPQDQEPIGTERVTAVVTTTEDENVVWLLAHVVYFAATSGYTLDAEFVQ